MAGADDHKWGKSPFHFIASYYARLRDYLKILPLKAKNSESLGADSAETRQIATHDVSGFGQKIFEFKSFEELLGCEFRDDGIYRAELGASIYFDVMVKGVKYFNIENPVMLVCFGGAITGRNGKKAPFFSGVNIARELELPLLAISDITLSLDSTIPLAWYAGNEWVTGFQKMTATFIDSVASKFKSRVLMFGGSGGGFSALVQSTLLQSENTAFVWNPQTNICEYNQEFVSQYMELAFPESCKNLGGLGSEGYSSVFAKHNIIFDICGLSLTRNSKVLYVQNSTDWHVKKHFMPFVDKKGFSEVKNGVYVGDGGRSVSSILSWGVGHIPPPKQLIIDVLRHLANTVELLEVVGFTMSNINFNVEAVSRSKVQLKNKDSQLHASAWLHEGVVSAFSVFSGHLDSDEKCKFAFYLYVNGERKNVKWYSGDNTVSFDISDVELHNLSVVAFCLFPSGHKIRTATPVRAMYGTLRNGKVLLAIRGKPIAKGRLFFCGKDSSCLPLNEVEEDLDFKSLLSSQKISSDISTTFFLSESSVDGLSAVHIGVKEFGVDFNIPWAGNKLALDLLETPTPQLFSERFTFASRRHPDPEVTIWIAKRNLENLKTPRNIFINSAVVYAYKSLELFHCKANVPHLIEILDKAANIAKELDRGTGARNDNVHLTISTLMARIHCSFLLSDHQDVLFCGELMRCEVGKVEFQGYYSVNLVKGYFFSAISSLSLMSSSDFRKFFMEILVIKDRVDECIAANQPGWMFSEKKYIYAISDFVVEYLQNPPIVLSKSLVCLWLAEASRIKTPEYLRMIGEAFYEK